MPEELIRDIWQTILNYSTQYYVLIVLLLLAYIVMAFRYRIDYLIMKDDVVWRRWYKAVFRCPSCHRRLRPDGHPPNYLCPKCGNSFTFGDKAVKEWVRHRPMLTKGEFVRYLTLLLFLAAGATWLFTSGILNQ